MEQPDDSFFKLFLSKICAPRIMSLLVPAHFMFIQGFLIDGIVLEKEFQ